MFLEALFHLHVCLFAKCLIVRCPTVRRPNDTPGRFLLISPASVRLVVYVPGGALPVALRAPAAAVDGVPHLEAPPVVLGEAGGDGGPVGALAAADVGAEVLHTEQEQEYFFPERFANLPQSRLRYSISLKLCPFLYIHLFRF